MKEIVRRTEGEWEKGGQSPDRGDLGGHDPKTNSREKTHPRRRIGKRGGKLQKKEDRKA